MMLKVIARVRLYSGKTKRQTPFRSGYRPLFDVLGTEKTSGMITLLDRDEFKPGDEGIVEIKFLEADCRVGTCFQFFESTEPLGEGCVVEVMRL